MVDEGRGTGFDLLYYDKQVRKSSEDITQLLNERAARW